MYRVLLLTANGLLAAAPIINAQMPDKYTGDLLHPKQFVRVFEITDRGDSIPLFLPSRYSATHGNCCVEHVKPRAGGHEAWPMSQEIDRNSKIVLLFDQAWLLTSGIDATLHVDAQYNGKQIAVPGYTAFGHNPLTGSARFASATELRASLAELATQTRGATIAQQLYRVHSGNPQRARGDDVRISQEILKAITIVTEQRARLMKYSRPTGGGQFVPMISGSVSKDSLQLRTTVDSLDRRLDVLIASPEIESLVRSNLSHARSTALNYLHLLRPSFKVLSDTLNRPALTIVAMQLGRNPLYLAQLADSMGGSWLTDLEKSDNVVASDSAFHHNLDVVQRIAEGLVDLEGFSQGYQASLVMDKDWFLRTLANTAVKDAEIWPSGSGVPRDDVVVLTVANGTKEDPEYRALEVPFRLREFGLVRRVNDSFMFFRRLNVRPSRDSTILQNARDQVINDRIPRTVRLAQSVNYESVAGVTLGWTYYPRKDRRFLRWLQPGGGVNVSFPQFKTNEITVSPTETDLSKTTTTTEQSKSIGNSLDLGIGVATTFFDNAIVTTVGRDFTADRRGNYWSIGFSFVSLAKKVTQAVSEASQ